MDLIKDQIQAMENEAFQLNESISDEKAFDLVTLKYFYEENLSYRDLLEYYTDTSNDGGVDFVYYNEDEPKVIVAQCKYTQNLSYDNIIDEFRKMSTTIHCFSIGNTGTFNHRVKRVLQEALDRLPEEEAGNVEYILFTSAEINEEELFKKIEKGEYPFSRDNITIHDRKSISSKIQTVKEYVATVPKDKIEIDKANNILSYSSTNTEGIIVNVKSSSIISLYNKYEKKGLFDLNLRKFIKKKNIDEGIKRTLDYERENFWFYNNGLIIACEDYYPDGNTIKLENFSIVNGGQTTSLIGTYKGSNTQEFFTACKIIKQKDTNRLDRTEFFSKIAETTNSQKPIYPRDLKANAPEMVSLKRLLEDKGILLEIKRGEYRNRAPFRIKIRNDELGQIILSLVYQKPGTSRSGKRAIFDNTSIYNKLFKTNYFKEENKKNFLLDIIDLNVRYNDLFNMMKDGSGLNVDERIVLLNGKQVIFSLFGVLYSLANEDVSERDFVNDTNIFKDHEFVYSKIIGHYKDDDLDDQLEKIIKILVKILSDSYTKKLRANEITSISNYFKTDKKYIEDILKEVAFAYANLTLGSELKQCNKIFKRP